MYKHWNREPHIQVDTGLQWGNKAKVIQADLGTFMHIFCIFRHMRTCSKIIQVYSEMFRTLCNSTYSEPWYMQNQKLRHIQNPVKHLWWSILQTLLTAVVVFANYFRNISISNSLLFFNRSIFLPQKYLFYISKSIVAPGDLEPWILIYSCYVVIFFL